MWSRPLLQKARAVRFLLTDVDGVLTDGRIYLDPSGGELKVFNIYDGYGIAQLRSLSDPIRVGFVSGRRSEAVAIRAKELGIDEVHQGVQDKISILDQILLKYSLRAQEVAFVGDDGNDIPVMKRVGLAVSVPNGIAEAMAAADWVTPRRGGEGAVRDVADLLLAAKGMAR